MLSEKSAIRRLVMYYGPQLERSDLPNVCAGGFLNIGYWRDIALNGRLTDESRADSQRAMYRQALRSLDIMENDRLLEIASGRGRGCVLALDEFLPAEAHGVDIMVDQVERAKVENSGSIERYKGRLGYKQGSATALPYPNGFFDKIISIEACLYFSDMDQFICELSRVTRKPARVAVACVFATSSAIEERQWVHLFDESGVARGYSVTSLVRKMTDHGFHDVSVVSIGEHVWLGYKEWITQLYSKSSLAKKWYSGYKGGLFDYYLVTAAIPSTVI